LDRCVKQPENTLQLIQLVHSIIRIDLAAPPSPIRTDADGANQHQKK
jgi:hypothetical protein